MASPLSVRISATLSETVGEQYPGVVVSSAGAVAALGALVFSHCCTARGHSYPSLASAVLGVESTVIEALEIDPLFLQSGIDRD